MLHDKKTFGAIVGLLVVIMTTVIIATDVREGMPASESAVIQSTGVVTAPTPIGTMQYTLGDRILDGNGMETIWRGVGGSYLFHAGDHYQEAWQLHLPDILAMNVNTVRLAFRFPWDAVSEADVLDYTKLAWVVGFLGKNNIRSILDNHGGMGFGSEVLVHSWRELARQYVGDGRIAAYELFNEPGYWARDSWIRSKTDLARAYMQLTQSVREVDPNHIVVWQSPHYYIGPFEDIAEYLQPNVVYTLHRWWTERKWEFDIWTPEQLSYMTISYVVESRKKFNVPFWMGEFGSHRPFNGSNPEWLLAEQHLKRYEEQVVGWNLWMGETDIDKPWSHYLPFFPLDALNHNLYREPIDAPNPSLMDYVIDQRCADMFEPCRIELFHNGDYVRLQSGIMIRVIVNQRLGDGVSEVLSDEELVLMRETTITNVERTVEQPGDFNTNIYPIGYARNG